MASAPVGFKDLLEKVVDQKAGLRDYRHAHNTFVEGGLGLHPKYSFLFHVFIQLNPSVVNDQVFNALKSSQLSLLVKSVDLPNFSVDSKTLNAYNRPNIVQNKIKYDPVSIVFHDDSSNVVRDMWMDYYAYYYKDMAHTPNAFYEPFKYNALNSNNRFLWGFTPRDAKNIANTTLFQERYIKNIRIFSFHLGQYSEYILYNPVILACKHGKHSNSATTELLEHGMTFGYEGMQYNSGSVLDDSGAINADLLEAGFTLIGYDIGINTSPLPAQASQQNINQNVTETQKVMAVPGADIGAFAPEINLDRIQITQQINPNVQDSLAGIDVGLSNYVVPSPINTEEPPTATQNDIPNTIVEV